MDQSLDVLPDLNQTFTTADMADIDVVFLPVFDITRHENGLNQRTAYHGLHYNAVVSLNAEVEKVSKKIQNEIEFDTELYGYPIELVSNREKFGSMLSCLSCFFCKEIVRNPLSCRYCRQLYCKQCIEAASHRHCGKSCIAQSKPGALCEVVDVCVSIIRMLDCLIIKCGICCKEFRYDFYEEHRKKCQKVCEDCGLMNNGLGHECVNMVVTSMNKWKDEYKNIRRDFNNQIGKLKAYDSLNRRLIDEIVFLKSKLDELSTKRGKGGFRKRCKESDC